MGDVILRASGLTKIFGSLRANDSIDLDIEAGTIHAIAGENGAGKSTLMKMLYGVYKATAGEIIVDGKTESNWNASLAREKGISMVFQDFRLIPAFTVLENVFISMRDSGVFVPKKELRKKILSLAREYNLHVDPDAQVWQLDLGQRQHIEIIKVLINPDTRIMIFDEPTSVLAPHEVASFLQMLKKFRDNGYAILLITHKINEILAVADRITVLRQGKNVHEFKQISGFSENEIITKMLGEDTGQMQLNKGTSAPDFPGLNPVVLENLAVKDDHNREILQNVSFEIRPGEITGIAGISGNGQKELAEAIFGTRKTSRGRMRYGGEDITETPPEGRIRKGFRMVTEDPLHDNVVPGFTVLENMALVGLDILKKGWDIDWKAMEKQLASHTELKHLNVPAPERITGTLSGGNIQRMAFARAVVSRPRLLIASYPSRGLDVATVNAVYNTLLRLKAEGVAILLISEDLTELFTISDRIVVLAAGTAFGPYLPEDCTVNDIGRIMLKGDETNGTAFVG